MDKVDGRTKVLKGKRGHLMLSNPGKTWPEILVALLNEHGSVRALAMALGMDAQIVYKWVWREEKEGTMTVKHQPPRVWELSEGEHEA